MSTPGTTSGPGADGPSSAGTRDDFLIFGAAEQVGTVTVHEDGADIAVRLRVDNNGRGARLDERLKLRSGGIPADWAIDGTSLMGGPVSERLCTKDGAASWSSQADEGRADASPLYLAADTSPYSAWIYARAALAAGGTVGALPSGSVRASLLRQVSLDGPVGAVNADLIRVTGASMGPQYVLAEPGGRVAAILGSGTGGALDFSEIVVRSDIAGCRPQLAELYDDLAAEHLRDINARVRHASDQPVCIRNVRVFDPHARQLTGPLSVTWFSGRVTRLDDAAAAPGAGPVIDGAGGTLVAGLHDMHAHIAGLTGLLYLAAGVTTIRDMGNDNQTLPRLTADFDTGVTAGPRVVPSGFIEGRSQFSARMGMIPNTLAEALDAVRWYADRGYHQIKIYNSMNPDWVRSLTTEAHRLGMRAVGHVPAFTTPDRMIEDGYDEISHINQLMLGWLLDPGEDTRSPLRVTAMARAKDLDLDSPRVQRTVALMREHGVGLDTTAVILERLMLSRARTVIGADAPYLSHLPMSYQRARKRTYVPYSCEADLDAYDKSFGKLLDVISMLDAAGIALWPGTDDGSGFTVHRELELYAATGMPPADVLRRATYDCATHLGLGHSHGSIERGKAASFILVDGDPTADISAVRRVRMVVRDGAVYFPQEIYAELGIEPFAPPPAAEWGEAAGTAGPVVAVAD